jgi:hypothetical protein
MRDFFRNLIVITAGVALTVLLLFLSVFATGVMLVLGLGFWLWLTLQRKGFIKSRRYQEVWQSPAGSARVIETEYEVIERQ